MAFAQGTITRTPYTVGDDEFLILTWTDLETGTEAAATEGTIDKLPKLCRLLQYFATASASTVNPRFSNTALAAVGAHGDLGTLATTAISIKAEPNLLLHLPTGTLYYRDRMAASTATVVHTMVIKAGS